MARRRIIELNERSSIDARSGYQRVAHWQVLVEGDRRVLAVDLWHSASDSLVGRISTSGRRCTFDVIGISLQDWQKPQLRLALEEQIELAALEWMWDDWQLE